MIKRTVTLVIVTALTAWPAAFAQRAVLDDSLSPRQAYTLDLAWQSQDIAAALHAMLGNDDEALPPLRGYLPDVEILLDTRGHTGQRARVYLSLPATIIGEAGGTLELSWKGRGDFRSGSVRPGQQALVFEGEIERPVLQGVFDFTVALQVGAAASSFTFEPVYEIEVLD